MFTGEASERWGSAIVQPRRVHLGRTIMSSGLSDRSEAEASINLVVFDQAHLSRVLKNYVSYYNQARTHFELDKNAPDFRRPQETRPYRSNLNSGRASSSIRPGLGFD